MTGIWTTWQCQKCNRLNVAFLDKKKETHIKCENCGSRGILTFQPSEGSVGPKRNLTSKKRNQIITKRLQHTPSRIETQKNPRN